MGLTISMLILVISSWATGLFVLVKDHKKRMNQTFFLSSLAIGLWAFGFLMIIYAPNPEKALFWQKIWGLGGNTCTFFFLHFCTLFLPQKKIPKWLLPTAYALSILLILWIVSGIGTVVEVQTKPHGYFVLESFFFLSISNGLVFTVLLGGFICLVLAYRWTSIYIVKLQLRYLFIGAFTAMVPLFVGFFTPSGIYFTLSCATILAYICFAYAIVKYRLLDIETIIHRTIAYLTTSGIVLLGFLGLVSLSHLVLAKYVDVTSNWVLALMLLVFVQVNRVLYAPVQEKVDGLFYRNKYEYRTAIREFVDKLSSVINAEELFPSIVNTVVKRIHIRTAAIVVFDNKSGEYYLKYSQGISDTNRKYQKEDKFFSFLEHRPWRDVIEREQLLVDPQYNELKEAALQRFSELSAEVCLVLKMEEKLVGIVIFGPRMSGEAYKVDDIKLFQYIAGEVSTSIYNALHHDDLVEKEVMDKELSLGQDIQLGLLPENLPTTAGLDVYGHMQPARVIGGDYYDFLPQGNDELGIVIGDVSGKGAPAGLIMVMAKTIIQSFSDAAQFSTKEILLKVNKILERNTHANIFMTMIYMHWSGKDRRLRYTGGGQEHIIIYRKHNQNCEVFKAGGVGLGILSNEKLEPEVEEKNIGLVPGDGVVLFTDGATEATNNRKDMYGLDRLVAAVKRHGEMEARELLESLYGDIEDFRGAQPLYDDITMIVMKAK